MSKQRKKSDSGWESLKTFVFAILIALFIRTFFVQAFRIPSGSMEETLLIGDFLLVDKVTFGASIPGTDWRLPGLRKPRRGDIIVFKGPHSNQDLIKRCIAVEGETVRMENNQVFINGKPIEEPYKILKKTAGRPLDTFNHNDPVRDGGLWMMGDNRNNSQDSRYWGDASMDRVVGRAFVLYWSADPQRSPRWVQNMSESWMKGFFTLFMSRPRITRVGTWLAKDWSDSYQAGVARAPAVAP